MDKMWAGRFTKALNQQADDFNSSIRFDRRMVFEDIQGSRAHATMLGKQGILEMDEVEKILSGLNGICRAASWSSTIRQRTCTCSWRGS